MFHLVLTSTDGTNRFFGEARAFNGPTPSPGRGIELESIEQAKLLARRELAGERSYNRLTVVDGQGAIVASAVRAGLTGGKWRWEP